MPLPWAVTKIFLLSATPGVIGCKCPGVELVVLTSTVVDAGG